MKWLGTVLSSLVILVAFVALSSCSKAADSPKTPSPPPQAAEVNPLDNTVSAPEPPKSPVPAAASVPAPKKPQVVPKPQVASKPQATPKPQAVSSQPPALSLPLPPEPAPARVNPVTVPEIVAARPVAPLPPPPPPAPPKPTTRQVILPSGTLINVRTIDLVDSKSDRVGRTFRAALDEPVSLNGETVIPRGSDVDLKLTELRRAGDIRGTSEMQLVLERVFVDSKAYAVESNVYQVEGSSQGQKTARNAVIGGALGAAIGAITGGKKGAAIGGTAGAGGGVAAAIITKDQVRIEPESQLTFRLERPLEITLRLSDTSRR